MKKPNKNTAPQSNRARELRTELARKIASFIGSEENRANGHSRPDAPPTDRPDRSLFSNLRAERDCDRPGRKRVDLGRTTFIYGESRYLLTAVDLPIVSQIIEASKKVPCLAMSLKLEMPVIRELLSREEIQVAEAPSDSPAMATGEATVDFLSACCRLMDLLDAAQDIPFLSGLIQREIIYRILRGPRGTPSSDCNAGRSEPQDGKSNCVDQGKLREAATSGRSRTNHGYGPVHPAPSFPGVDRHESSSVSEAASLQAARGRMLVDGLDAASAAFEVGYESASQFNREYSRLFASHPCGIFGLSARQALCP